MAYAGKTKVGIESSQSEIRKIVNRYGATRFASMDEPGLSIIMFEVNDRRVKFSLTMPDISEFALTPGRRAKRSRESQYADSTGLSNRNHAEDAARCWRNREVNRPAVVTRV